VVLTSATLSIAGSFDFYQKLSWNAPGNARTPSALPFAYEKQAILYIPSLFPPPHERGFCVHLSEGSFENSHQDGGQSPFPLTKLSQYEGNLPAFEGSPSLSSLGTVPEDQKNPAG
jgi:hypothetical protein